MVKGPMSPRGPRRFDDRLATILVTAADSAVTAQSAVFRQLGDLFAQGRLTSQQVRDHDLLQILQRAHQRADLSARVDVARMLGAFRLAPPALVSLLVQDSARDVWSLVIDNAAVPETHWLQLLPKMRTEQIGALSARVASGTRLAAAIRAMGAGMLGLPAPDAVAAAVAREAEAPQAVTSTFSLAAFTHVVVTPDRLDDGPAASEAPARDHDAAAPIAASIFAQDAKEAAAEPAATEPETDSTGRRDVQEPVFDLTRTLVLDTPVSAKVLVDSWSGVEFKLPPVPEMPSLAASLGPQPESPAGGDIPLEELEPTSEQQIQLLIDRIASYTHQWQRPLPSGAASADDIADAPPPAEPDSFSRVRIAAQAFADITASAVDWRWETNALGEFTIVEPSPLADPSLKALSTLNGASLLSLAGDPDDREAIEQAMRQRTPFRQRRIRIEVGVARGEWWLAGVPVFDQRTGVFTGFRGTAARPVIAAVPLTQPVVARPREAGLLGTGIASDPLSAMAHELRTPLNAIMGFAQMIEQEAWGPVADGYRDNARMILEKSNRLLEALDDLSEATRLDRGTYTLEQSRIAPAALVARLVDNFQGPAKRRGVFLLSRVATGLPLIFGDSAAIERALSRMLLVVCAAADAGESVFLTVRPEMNDAVHFEVTRPQRLRAMPADALLDPWPISGEAGEAPATGVGFSLRLSRQLATAMGGRFAIEDHVFRLVIPAVPPTLSRTEESPLERTRPTA